MRFRPIIYHSVICHLFLVMPALLFAQKDVTVINVPANWKQNGLVVRLKDDLKCPGFSWPQTLLQYRLNFGTAGINKEALAVTDAATGKAIPFQLTALAEKENKIQQATLLISSDLPSGADRSFRITTAGSGQSLPAHAVVIQKSADNIILSNDIIKVEIPSPGTRQATAPVVRYGNTQGWLGYGEIPAVLKTAQMSVQQVTAGSLLTVFKVSYALTDARRYEVLLQLEAGMEFITLEETMTGFTGKDSLAWKMVWNGMQPKYRYTTTRGILPGNKPAASYAAVGWEPMEGISEAANPPKHPIIAVDQQNDASGKLPFHLATYDNWMTWWRLPVAAFWNETQPASVGLFVKDTEKWNDGQYPIWGSKDNLSIAFHWNNNILDYSFPLVQGTRSTAIAAYPHQKDIDLVTATGKPLVYIDYLRRWYGWVSLDKTKNWILDYPATAQGSAPAFFKPEKAGKTLPLSSLEQGLRNMVNSINQGSERYMGPTPVGVRVFYDAYTPSFDLNKTIMTEEQFRRLRAWFLFMNYVFMDEALMPVRNMLSGHPNFLSDLKSVSGQTAFLFPDHPQATEMADHFEKAMQLNMRYHVRPEVAAWEAGGGRWTENLATYTWAALRPALRSNYLLHHYYDGRNRMLQPGIGKLGNWLLNALTSPLELAGNRRTFSPQGAHAQDFHLGPPELLRQLAQEFVYYDPLLAEHLFAVTTADDHAFESQKEKAKLWDDVLKGEWANNKGTMPQLHSAKYTGYGFVLRHDFGSTKEMYVHLQQIDNGPNYRWGRAAGGGNGVIYYTAAGKRYSFNGVEDVGDGPFGDVERCTNFGVKKTAGYRELGPYRSVGRNDLTAPLYDFGFAQFATLHANAASAPDYRSRSILQGGGDYIVVLDDVAGDNIEGRFSWFVGKDDRFPAIHQLTPGVAAVDAAPQSSKSGYHTDPAVLPIQGRYYDGKGDFLTLVTHKEELKVARTPYGCDVRFPDGRTDKVFRSGNNIQYNQDGIVFSGSSGIVKQDAAGKAYAAALFEGNEIGAGILQIRLAADQSAGISFETAAGGYTGRFQARTAQKLRFVLKVAPADQLVFYIDGVALPNKPGADGSMEVLFTPGLHHWQWSMAGVIPQPPVITRIVTASGRCTVEWAKAPGAASYEVQLSADNGNNWKVAASGVTGTSAVLSGLQNNTKIQVRVIATGAGGPSAASDLYPAYINNRAPHYPEGLVVLMEDKKLAVSWGEILGAGSYKLYKRKKGAADTTWQQVYSGSSRVFREAVPATPIVWEYAVTAINGNGESSRSNSSDTDKDRFLNWQPKPGEGFRRDTENHENGFPEFIAPVEDKMPVLTYPSVHTIKTSDN
jgi:hypothetical protein